MTIRESTILLIGVALIFVAAGIAMHLWGPQSVGPCEIDAPMEQAQCRAQGEAVERAFFGGEE